YVLGRIRAGLLEEGTVALLDEVGAGARAHREGLVHRGVELAFGGARHRIDMHAATGKTVMIYGQTEVTLDLMNARAAAGLVSVYEARDVTPYDFDTDHPHVSYVKDGVTHRIDDHLDHWPDERFWDELKQRLDQKAVDNLVTGPSIEKSIAPLRSFVAEPMRFGRMFLAGDAAHIVPPTGAKGLNLAASDVHYLSQAFREFYAEKSPAALDGYSAKALSRVWKAVRFSWWMTSMLHKFPDTGEFGARIQLAELDYLVSSKAAMTSLSENYVGLPF